jgi:hypothetical protein
MICHGIPTNQWIGCADIRASMVIAAPGDRVLEELVALSAY